MSRRTKRSGGGNIRPAVKAANPVEAVEEYCDDDHNAVAYEAGFSAGLEDGLTQGYGLGCQEVFQSIVNRAMALALSLPNVSPQRAVVLRFAVETIIVDGLPDNRLRQTLLREVEQAIVAQEDVTKTSA